MQTESNSRAEEWRCPNGPEFYCTRKYVCKTQGDNLATFSPNRYRTVGCYGTATRVETLRRAKIAKDVDNDSAAIATNPMED